jgi:hypothetical protein
MSIPGQPCKVSVSLEASPARKAPKAYVLSQTIDGCMRLTVRVDLGTNAASELALILQIHLDGFKSSLV